MVASLSMQLAAPTMPSQAPAQLRGKVAAQAATQASELPAPSNAAAPNSPVALAAAAAVGGALAAGVSRQRRRSNGVHAAALPAASVVVPSTSLANGGRRRTRGGRTATRAVAVAPGLTRVSTEEYVREDVRNIAIIAHVDHGKTTLTDGLMKQTRDKGAEDLASMDSNQLEAERGITILAKNAAVNYKGVKINLIDTPGHADFGGEVERILNMADACLLLVDAQEGPMPQTKFVLRLALKLNKKVIVCINKVDKPAARPDWVLDNTFDLFASLGACDEQCDFPVVYASGFQGKASVDAPDELEDNLFPILDMILEQCPLPSIEADAPLQMLVSNLDYDQFIGRISIGRLRSGSLKVGDEIGFQYGEGSKVRKATISKLWEFHNNSRREVPEILGGDICAFTGMEDVVIGDTIVDAANPRPLPPIEIQEPTVVMEFGPNTSPFSGQCKESQFLTGSQIKARLEREVLTNLALRVEPGKGADSFRVKGRGTLQLGILMENMRREGYEFMVSPPEVLLRKDPDSGAQQEPYEEAVIEVPSEHQGVILEEMNKKGAVMQGMESGSLENTMVLTFEIPTRNLIGMQGKFMQRTKGSAVMSSRFARWGEFDGKLVRIREKGSIVNNADGVATAYILLNMKNKGSFFVEPAEEVYAGMCIGIHVQEFDLTINATKEKNVTNVRSKNAEQVDTFPPAIKMTIDDYLGHMDIDEKLEVTPAKLRLLKASGKARKGK